MWKKREKMKFGFKGRKYICFKTRVEGSFHRGGSIVKIK